MINDKKNIFIFIGPPGSGKGSLASLCVDTFNWLQLSTGNLCRKHIFEQTALGKEMDLAIRSGGLVGDSLITAIVEQWLFDMQDDNRSIILDGYPRSVGQAEAFRDILKEKFADVNMYVVLFAMPDEQLIGRLNSRLMCQNKECQAVYSSIRGSEHASKESMTCEKCGGALGRRDDDRGEAIVVRLAMYHQHTQPLIDFYRNEGQPIIELHAGAPLNEVFEEFKRKICTKMV
jgi:adenylate kinase